MNPAPAAGNALLVVLVITAAQMAVAMSNLVLPTIAPKLAESLGVTPALIGYQVSLVFGAAALSTILGGVAVLRWGAARATQVSIGLCALGLALFALPHFAAIALGSVAVGAGMGLANPAAAHLLVKYTPPERRNLMFSIKQTGVPVGGVLIALTAPALAVVAGWRWSLVMLLVMIVPLILFIQRFRDEWDPDRDPGAGLRQQPFGGVPMVWRRASLRWISLVALLFSGIQRCLLTFIVVFLVAEAGYGLIEAGVMLSVVQVGGSVSRIGWGWMADRIGSSIAVLTVICLITIGATLALAMLGPEWPKPLVYALFFVLGAASLGWNGVFHAEAARLSPPGMASIVAGGTTFFVFAGVLIGPAAFAAAYGAIGSYAATFSLLAAAGVVALVLLAAAHGAGRRHD